jgi:4'-phosphopantetheinyl transferase
MSKIHAPNIFVWTATPDSVPESHWGLLSGLLDAAERQRAARFIFERHRRQYVAAHALKRLMLTSIAGPPPWSWAFGIAPGGKPYVNPNRRPWFNIAHSETLVVCAVSQECELGIDVEPIARLVPPEIAEEYFPEAERRWIDSLPSSDRGIGRLRLWTLKEAFIKATGRGLAQPLQDFSFEFEPIRVRFLDAGLGDNCEWHFEQREICRHLLAVAWRHESRNASMDIQETRLDGLLSEALGRTEGP